MKTHKMYLRRLAFVVWSKLSREFAGLSIDLVADVLEDGFSFKLRAEIFGRKESKEVVVDIPDGRWQAVRAAFGFKYRKRQITFTVFQLFPEIRSPGNTTEITWIEADA